MAAFRLADLHQRRYQPERAHRERALLACEAVVGGLGAVPQHEVVDGEVVGDGQHGSPDPPVVRRKEADQRHQLLEAGAVRVYDHPRALLEAGDDALSR
ncbi:hypothetical protein ACFPIJ_62100 [Dactylosporangium cerinum]|uniref:Uncharacterized protein n=1 Tax=Dactylosporangium cerinum TaxID=1434730 RepID=A0ABV9WIF9_9ACTN